MFPDVAGEPLAGSSSGTFFTCSADGTVRLWGTEERTQTHQNRQNTLSRVSLVSPKRLKVSAFQLSPESSAFAGSFEHNLHGWKHQRLTGRRMSCKPGQKWEF